MTTEYHNRIIDGRRLSWDVSKLIAASRSLPLTQIELSDISEIDSVYWFDDEHPPTCRAVIEHARRIASADLADPILLSHDGFVIDGMHRVARALLDGITSLPVRRLAEYPPPDRLSGVGQE